MAPIRSKLGLRLKRRVLNRDEEPAASSPLPGTCIKSHSEVRIVEHNIDTVSNIVPPTKMNLPPHGEIAEPQAIGIISTKAITSPLLEVLPADLHYYLTTRYLDFDSVVALRQTCRQMHHLLNPALLRRIRSGIVSQFLVDEVQQLRDYRDVYPLQRFGRLWDIFYAAFDWRLIDRPAKELKCYGCLETKPLWYFVERMSSRGTGLAGKLAKDRMCKDCMLRYRNIGGIWWKENWLKKSEMVRRTSRVQRVRRWILEGRSLINPAEEIGVCCQCGTGAYELWWGCAACFEKEEKRRREEDLDDLQLDGISRRATGVFESWRVQKESWRRKRSVRSDRRRKWWKISLGLSWEGNLDERLEALAEWKRFKNRDRTSSPAQLYMDDSGEFLDTTAPWRAVSQHPIRNDRREARCPTCWIPNCPRRLYMLGLAYERQLPPDRWCDGCKTDHDEKSAKRKGLHNHNATMIQDDDDYAGIARLFE